jgi:hypothetical protein
VRLRRAVARERARRRGRVADGPTVEGPILGHNVNSSQDGSYPDAGRCAFCCGSPLTNENAWARWLPAELLTQEEHPQH